MGTRPRELSHRPDHGFGIFVARDYRGDLRGFGPIVIWPYAHEIPLPGRLASQHDLRSVAGFFQAFDELIGVGFIEEGADLNG
jgi:hypothetical protein